MDQKRKMGIEIKGATFDATYKSFYLHSSPSSNINGYMHTSGIHIWKMKFTEFCIPRREPTTYISHSVLSVLFYINRNRMSRGMWP
jgi:hypothetical protein